MIIFFLFCIGLIGLSGCGGGGLVSVHEYADVVQHVPEYHQFRLRVQGVECELCAQEVVDIVHASIDGAAYVDFVLSGTNYDHGYIQFSYDVTQNNFSVSSLEYALHQEGFELISLDGPFYINLLSHEGRQYALLSKDMQLPFCCSDNKALRSAMRSCDKNCFFAQGSIKRDQKKHLYFSLSSSS